MCARAMLYEVADGIGILSEGTFSSRAEQSCKLGWRACTMLSENRRLVWV